MKFPRSYTPVTTDPLQAQSVYVVGEAPILQVSWHTKNTRAHDPPLFCYQPKA